MGLARSLVIAVIRIAWFLAVGWWLAIAYILLALILSSTWDSEMLSSAPDNLLANAWAIATLG